MTDLKGFIEELKSRLPIEEVVGEHVRLERRGRRYVGRCPFHPDRSPSFSVDPAEGFYYCFGCHKGGDAITFVREREGLEFLEAVRRLAEQAGMELPRDFGRGGGGGRRGEDADRRKQRREALALARRFFEERLAGSEGAAGREYLASRGVTEATWRAFGLGWAPRDRRALVAALTRAGIPVEVQEEVGLVLRDPQGGVKARLWERVVFPVADSGGRTVGFGGRYLPGSFAAEKELGKYVNSPEGPTFQKRRLLYGMDRLAQGLRDAPDLPILVTEGYLDVVLLHQAGLTTAVAALGTALTEEHARRLKRWERPVLLLLDADPAGRRAAARGGRHLVAEGVDVRVADLPEGRDPADLVQAGEVEELRGRVAAGQDILEWRLHTWLQKADLKVPAVLDRAAREMAEWIATTPSPVVAEAWTRRAASALGISEAALTRLLPHGSPSSTGPVPPPSAAAGAPRTTGGDARGLLTANEREVVAVLLRDPSLHALHRSALESLRLEDPVAARVLAWARSEREAGRDPDLEAALIAHSDDDEVVRWLDGLRFLRLERPAETLTRALEALPHNREACQLAEAEGWETLRRFQRPIAVSPRDDASDGG